MSSNIPDEVNMLKPARLKEISDKVKSNPQMANEMSTWRVRLKWLGALRSRAYMRDHTVNFDEPSDISGFDTGASAHEHILSALGACISTGYVYQATQKGIKIHDMEVAIEGKLENIVKFFDLNQAGSPGYKDITVKLYIKADADKKTLEQIWKDAIEGSPVANTIMRNVNIKPEFQAV